MLCKKGDGGNPTSALDKVLNSRKGSYFSVKNDDSPRSGEVDGIDKANL